MAHRQLGQLEDAGIVGERADDDGDASLAARLLHVARQARHRQRRPVDARHKQPLQHDAVELGVGAARQESVQLHVATDKPQSQSVN